jgi:hypothetical protein
MNALKQVVYITDVRKGSGKREHILYAHVRDANTDEVLIAATLEYCVKEAYERYTVESGRH